MASLGEFDFIERIRSRVEDPAGIIGIGDDCAVLPMNPSEDLVVTTDLLVEDVHFLLKDVTAEQLGYKTAAVNLSDIAAMGASPWGCFLSIAMPSGISENWLDRFMDSFVGVCDFFGAPLLGGDTTLSKGGLAINLAVLGKVESGHAKLRNGARPGDIVCCTGSLGDSGAGLDIILERAKSGKTDNEGVEADSEWLVKRHYNPTPRVKSGRILSGIQEVHSMMDVSDGIASDLKHILKSSSAKSRTALGADIWIDKLPLSSQLTRWCSVNGRDAQRYAVCSGEDYELLLTIDPSAFERVEELLAPICPLTAIGEITIAHEGIDYLKDGVKLPSDFKGFAHF